MAKRFIPPTPAEATAYAATIGFQLDGEEFCDFYAVTGWKRGNTPMSDWRAAVRTWKRRQKNDKGRPLCTRQDNHRLLASIDQKYLDEYAGRLAALRSWRGKPDCPLGDVSDAERRLLSKIRDTHGQDMVAQVIAKCKEVRSC